MRNRGEVWTWARIAQVIEEEFGVYHHKDRYGHCFSARLWSKFKRFSLKATGYFHSDRKGI